MDGFLTFVLIVIVGFWLLGILGRAWLRMLIRRNGNGATGGSWTFGGAAGNRGRSRNTRPEGEVTVTDNETPGTPINRRVGEYVEYEEVGTPDNHQ